MMTNIMTPSQYFGLDTKSRYSGLFNEIYKLTQVSQVEAEIEDGEIEVEEDEPSEPVDIPQMEDEINKERDYCKENDFPSTAEDLSCKSLRGDSVRHYQARPASHNPILGLQFPPFSLPPGSLQFPLTGGYPLTIPFPPLPLLPARPWPHHPPLFMPSVPPPPPPHHQLPGPPPDVFVPPDEKVPAQLIQVINLIMRFAGVQRVPGV